VPSGSVFPPRLGSPGFAPRLQGSLIEGRLPLDLDALLLSRLQFAFTISFHILFPAFTIGLASYLAVLEGLWLATGKAAFKTLYLFWVKVFALSFGMGVVSGVVLSYQFGTNWSDFIRITGGVIGPLLAFEVLTAFFLEASFLGVMLFGWRKVGPRLHFLATVLVALGTATSAFWILAANSWMQTPQGFAVMADGRYVATDFMQVIFNPSFPSRFVHMMLAAYLTTALAVGGASAYQLLKRRDDGASRIALRMAVGMIAIAAPLQLAAGHLSGEVARVYQPSKLAAIEAYWESGKNHPLNLVAIPDRAAEKNHFQIAVPGAGAIVAPPDVVVRGLKSFAPKDRPPVFPVFWGFRVMVALGVLMIVLGFWGAVLIWRRRLEESRLFLRFATAMGPAGFLAVLAGWIVTEVGRQPYVVFGVLRTDQTLSPVTTGQVATSLLTYLIVYSIVFAAGAIYILRLLAEGPTAAAHEPQPEPRPPGWALGGTPGGDAS